MAALTTRTDWNPWRDFFNLDEVLARAVMHDRESQAAKAPIDFFEDDNKFTLLADFPGVKKEDLKVDFKDGVLTLVGTRHQQTEEKNKKEGYFRKERHTGRIERSINLGDKIDPNKIEAMFDGGVLKMLLPKKTEQRSLSVKIN